MSLVSNHHPLPFLSFSFAMQLVRSLFAFSSMAAVALAAVSTRVRSGQPASYLTLPCSLSSLPAHSCQLKTLLGRSARQRWKQPSRARTRSLAQVSDLRSSLTQLDPGRSLAYTCSNLIHSWRSGPACTGCEFYLCLPFNSRPSYLLSPSTDFAFRKG